MMTTKMLTALYIQVMDGAASNDRKEAAPRIRVPRFGAGSIFMYRTRPSLPSRVYDFMPPDESTDSFYESRIHRIVDRVVNARSRL
jgi:hypothetical protein